MTHRVVDPDARDTSGISEGLLRLSVGLEHPDDLWADLGHALDRVQPRRPADREVPVLTGAESGVAASQPGLLR